MDVDKYKIRNWAKEDFPALAKYLNNKRYGIIVVIAYHILILKTMRNSSSSSFQIKTNKIIIVSK